jgi:hypothetical protein
MEGEGMGKKQRFNTVAQVFRHLEGEGYKVSRSTVFDHVRAGKLRSGRTGFSMEDVQRYAQAFLLKKSVEEETDELQRRRLRAQSELLELKARAAARAAKREAEAWISKDQFILEVCSRASMMKASLQNLAFLRLPVYRSAQTHEEAVDLYLSDIDELLTRMVDQGEYFVTFAEDKITVQPFDLPPEWEAAEKDPAGKLWEIPLKAEKK